MFNNKHDKRWLTAQNCQSKATQFKSAQRIVKKASLPRRARKFAWLNFMTGAKKFAQTSRRSSWHKIKCLKLLATLWHTYYTSSKTSSTSPPGLTIHQIMRKRHKETPHPTKTRELELRKAPTEKTATPHLHNSNNKKKEESNNRVNAHTMAYRSIKVNILLKKKKNPSWPSCLFGPWVCA